MKTTITLKLNEAHVIILTNFFRVLQRIFSMDIGVIVIAAEKII